jgi:hypothetical protein
MQRHGIPTRVCHNSSSGPDLELSDAGFGRNRAGTDILPTSTWRNAGIERREYSGRDWLGQRPPATETDLLASSWASSRLGDRVMGEQISGKGARGTVVKQDEHLTERWRFGAVRSELQDRLDLFARHAEFFNQLVYAHVLKVSNTVETGIRVPRNTHAPVRFSGTLSTAAH